MAKRKIDWDGLLPWAIVLLIILWVAAYYNRKAFDEYDERQRKGSFRRRGEIQTIDYSHTC